MRLAARLALPALLLAAAPAPAPAAKSPVAVLPFKNLGGDPGLDWLGDGIAETMISDLRKSGKLTLVERDQMNAVLAEILEQSTKPQMTDDATAIRMGRLVGARTMVVGGYQAAGKKLRINARFVDVETGVILDSVKADGSVDDPFGVQDQVVAKLLGLPPKSAPVKTPRKTTPKSVEAYRLYALSTVALSDAERQSYLKQAVEIDPDFTYAGEALARLEDRLAAYETQALKALDERHRAMRAKIHDSATPATDRAQLAVQLMNELVQRRRFRLAAEEAKRIYDLKLPPAMNLDPREWASNTLVVAHKFLKRDDLTLQYAERHLQEFPAGGTYTVVDMTVKEIVQRRKQAELERSKRIAEHAKIDNELAARPKDSKPETLAQLESTKCVWGRYTILPRETEEDCRLFLEKWSKADPPPVAVLLRARYHRALALYEMGRFAEAIAEIDAIEKEAPVFATEMNIRTATGFWILE